MSESTSRLGRIAILWRGDEAARRSATADTGRFKAVFAALAECSSASTQFMNRANLDALLREVAGRGVWVSAHPDMILKMGTKEMLHRTCTGWTSFSSDASSISKTAA